MGKTREELEQIWSDSRHWKWWRYYSREDPRVIVPKRARWRGWTINFAHPHAWFWLILLIVLTVAPFAAVTLFLAAQHELNIPLQLSVLVATIVVLVLICVYYSDFKDYSK